MADMMSTHTIESVFEQHRDDLVRFANRRVRCPQVAADIVQISFERVLRQERSGMVSVRYLRAYLYTIVNNQCKDYYQGVKRARRYSPLILQADALRLSDCFPMTEDLVTRLELLDKLQTEVNNLPPKSRMAFTLVEIHHYSVREVARIMEMKEMAVYQLVNRSYATLAQRIAGVTSSDQAKPT